MTLATDCIHYYKLDESSGDAIDAEGSEDGTITGVTQNVSGKINTAYDFETSDTTDSVNFSTGDWSEIDYNVPFSMQAWVKFETVGDWNIISKNETSSPYNGWRLAIQGSGTRIGFDLINTVISNWYTPYISWTPSVDTWYHIVVTYDGNHASDSTNIYIDGSGTQGTVSNNNISATVVNTTIGSIGNRAAGQAGFDGIIDEVSFWDVELTSTQVTELYNSGDGFAYPFTTSQDLTETINEGHISDDGSKQFLEYTKDISESSTLTDGIVVTSTGDAISSSFDFNNGIITTAKLTATESVGTGTYYLSADGGVNWELVTNGTTHTFTNTGTDLRWKAKGNSVTITRLVISDYR